MFETGNGQSGGLNTDQSQLSGMFLYDEVKELPYAFIYDCTKTFALGWLWRSRRKYFMGPGLSDPELYRHGFRFWRYVPND